MRQLFASTALAGALFTGLGALTLGSTAAMAGSVTNASATFNQNAFDNNGNLSVSLAQFDASLGTLTGATLVFAGITGPQFEVLNVGFNGVAGIGQGTSSITYALTGNGASLTETASSGVQTVSVGPAFLDLASSPPVLAFFDLSQTLASIVGLTGPGNLTFLLTEAVTTSGTTLTPGATLAFGGTASSNFGLSITYDYVATDVPEPMSLALLGLGVAGLAGVRHRRA